jgi:catechol 2,3-dioxygenase-like lactoylglutathione lyase family enzyme
MSSTRIDALRSIALEVPDLGQAEAFYTVVWGLAVAARAPGTVYLRGTGADHHLLALHAGGEVPRIRRLTLRARDGAALAAIAADVASTGGTLLHGPGPADDPAGGTRLVLRDAHGRVIDVVHGDARHADASIVADRPIRLTHVVLNSHDVDATQRFLERVLDFRLADRTGILAFMNCGSDHHTLAIGITDNDALNHIAFLMPDLDSVMRGGGRLKDAGHPIQWGPGRHGPGNNLFNYFLDPFGVPIEYTAEVQQIDEHYPSRGPEYWKWRPGRFDHWGISAPPSATLRDAQRRVGFAA